MASFIDLTVSSDDEATKARPAPKRYKRGSTLAGELTIVEAHPAAAAPRNAAAVDTEDDSVVVVGASGNVWNSDLPHTRDLCGVHPFNKQPSASNEAFCNKCFCFICDVPASSCLFWGTGTSRTNHANAHSGEKRYKLMRELRNKSHQENQNVNLAASAAAAAAGPSFAAAARPSAAVVQRAPASTRPWPVAAPAAAAAPTAAAAPESRPLAAAAAAAAAAPKSRPLAAAAPAVAAARPVAAEAAPAAAAAGPVSWARRLLGIQPSQVASEQVDLYRLLPPSPPSPASGEPGPKDEMDVEVEEQQQQEQPHQQQQQQQSHQPQLSGQPAEAPRQEQMRQPAQQQRPVQPCNLVEMPDPRTDPSLMELATVKLRCKAARGITMHDIVQRLAPNGFYMRKDYLGSPGDRLSLDNICEYRYDYLTSQRTQVVLELQPLPMPDPPAEPGHTRVRQVTIYHYDGREAPTTYGVTVNKVATINDIIAAAAPLIGLSAAEEALSVQVDVQMRKQQLSVPPLGTQVTDAWTNLNKLALWRLPARHSKGDASSPDYAVVYHKMVSMTDGYEHHRPVGRPTIVSLGSSYADGGEAAERVLLERVLAALAPLRKEDAPPVQVDDLLGAGMKLERTGPVPHYAERSYQDGKLFLRLDWADSQLQHYNMEAAAKPAVHASASASAMKETEDYIKAHSEWRERESEAKSLPLSMMKDLASAAKMQQPGVDYAAHYHSEKPLVRVRLQLCPDSPRHEETNGVLKAMVFVWRNSSVTCRPFFLPPDEWISKARHAYDHQPTGLPAHFYDVLLWEDAQHQAMGRELREWSRRDWNARKDVKGLMEALEREELPAAQQPAGLTVQMRPYQLQSLQFMLDRERREGGFRSFLWLPMTTPKGERWWYSSVLQRASLDVPEMPCGGFCAEEMGLGKTVEVLSLILANPAPALPDGVQKTPTGLIKSSATLVVCPVSLCGQWISEVGSKLGPGVRVHLYHGQGRIKDPVKLATKFDIVVTTYSTLGADFGKGQGQRGEKQPPPKVNGNNNNKFPPLGSIKWHRLVLDESHTVKNPSVGHSRACMALQADRRWLLSGTPISTEVTDLQGQFCVLGMVPFNINNFFMTQIKCSYQMWSGQLLYTLGQCMIRHTKRQQLGGEEVLNLPPLHQEDVAVHLTASEQDLYKTAHSKAKAVFDMYRAQGAAACSRSLLQIMALLLPMRRLCSGGQLKPKDLEVAAAPVFVGGGGAGAAAAAAADLTSKDASLVAPEEECAICIDLYEHPMLTSCSHWFCKECILGVLQNGAARCPLCRGNLNPAALRAGVTAAEAAAAAAAAVAPEGAEAGGEGEAAEEEQPATVVESKLQMLLKQLRAMRRANKSSKALIFSQFTTTIEWLKVRLTEESFGYRYISGSMPLKQRAKAIQQFQADPPTTVFIISMRTGSVGINLTAADHVFLMEPCLNPSLEDQAVGRSWRMGQARPVTVRRFYVQGSVEERIIEVVRQRQAAGARLAGDHRANVRVQEAAGNIQADKQQLRLEELEQLFKDPELPAPREPEPSIDEEEEEEVAQLQQEQQMEDEDQPGTSAAHAARAAGASRGGAVEGIAGVGGRRGVSRAAARRAMEQRRWCQQDGEAEGSDGDMYS